MDIQTALEHHRAGRLAEAVQIYRQILEAEPGHPDALHLLGNAACQLGEAELAVSLIAQAHTLVPDNTAYLATLGMACRAAGRLDDALACYEEILKLEPASATACFGIANTRQGQGLPDQARAYFLKALALQPGLVEARYNLANLEKSLGNYAQAVAHYRSAVATHPGFADAWHNLGSALYALGELDEAMAAYRQALIGDLPETHNNIGNIHYDQGRYDAALACYERAIALRPAYAEAYNNSGNTLRRLDRHDAAAAAFAQAVALAPGYAVAHLNLGDLALAAGDTAQAASHYGAAAAAAPSMAGAHFHLGVALARLHRLDDALASFERALACRPDYTDALYNLGVVQGRLLRFADAEGSYRRALALDPGHLDAHINLSAILIDDDRRDEAQTHIDFAYGRRNLFERPAPAANKTVLLLLDGGKGNLNLTYLFDRRSTSLIDWMIAYAAPGQESALPPYDLVFNAMGDPDLTRNTAQPLARFMAVCARPLLNLPDSVARTARDRLPGLLQGIDGLVVPRVWRFADQASWDPDLARHLPLLLRPIHSHGGVGLTLAATAAELTAFKARQNGPVYVSPYVEYRSADGWFRKYRMIFIDRRPYPYHLAISPNWVVHYYNAGMREHPWKLEEESRYLAAPERVLGKAGMAAIRAIGARLDLDYAGLDFTVLPDGRILVFEANPTMLVHPEDPAGPLAHKNGPVQRIFDAFEALLDARAGAGA